MADPAFLDALSPEDRAVLLARVRLRRVRAGDHVLREGEPPDHAALVIRGRVRLVARAGHDEVVLGVRGPGDLLGEVAVLDGAARTVSAVALEAGEVGVLSALDLRRFLAGHPDAALLVLRLLTARLREADAGRVGLATQDAPSRIAARLVELAGDHGVADDDGGVRIALPITQDDLAGWTGCSRQAVARALADLRRAGTIRTARRAIVVCDLAALRGASTAP